MNESAVEKNIVKRVRDAGGEAYKFVSPGRSGVPDRLILLPVPVAWQPLVQRYVRFVEAKAPGKKPKKIQPAEHEYLRKLGYRVDVVDSKNWNL